MHFNKSVMMAASDVHTQSFNNNSAVTTNAYFITDISQSPGCIRTQYCEAQ